MAVSFKLLVRSEPKIKEETCFVLIVFWVVVASGKAETIPTFRRKFLLLRTLRVGYMNVNVLGVRARGTQKYMLMF